MSEILTKIEQYRAMMAAAAVIGVELSKDPLNPKPFEHAVSIAIELDSDIRNALSLEEQV